ncbi:hypothetical protein RFY10_13380, partial [Acinetobacter baumannii]|nr:hypothetical protein [Acinetobacter baumannii]
LVVVADIPAKLADEIRCFTFASVIKQRIASATVQIRGVDVYSTRVLKTARQLSDKGRYRRVS